MKTPRFLSTSIGALLTLLPVYAHAQVIKTITGSTNTRVWGLNASWNPANIPVGTESVVIASTGIVNISGSAFQTGAVTSTSIASLTFNGTGALNLRNNDTAQNMTLNLDGGSSTLIGAVGPRVYTIEKTAAGTTRTLGLQLRDSGNFDVGTGGTLNILSDISESGGSRFVRKTGAGTLVLAGTNTFTNDFIINAGRVTLSGSLATNREIYINATGTLDVTSSVLNTYTIFGGDRSTFILNGRVGNGSVLNLTGGTGNALATIASGTGSVFTTNVNNKGIARVTGVTAAGSTMNVNTGGLLTGSGTVNGTTTIAAGGSIQGGNSGVGNLTLSNLTFATGATSIAFRPGNSVNVTAANGLIANGVAGSVSINVQTIGATGIFPVLDYSGVIGGTGINAFVLGQLPNRTVATLDHNVGQTRIELNVTSFDFPVWTGLGGGEWEVATQTPKNWVLNSNAAMTTDFQDTDIATFTDSATDTNVFINGADVLPSSVVFNNSSKNYAIEGVSAISGATGITKSGTGRVSIATSNSFTGAVVINAGTLAVSSVADEGTDSALGKGGEITINGGTLEYTGNGLESTDRAVTLNANATIKTTQAVDVTLSGRISGAGALTKTGPGTLILTGADNAYGNTVVTEGQLQVGDSSSLGSLGTGTVANNAELIFDLPSEATVTPTISGTGILRKRGIGTLTIGDAAVVGPANSYTGSTIIESGILTASKTNGPAIPGNLTIEGGALYTTTTANQIGDNAIVTINGGQFGDSSDNTQRDLADTFRRIDLVSGVFTTTRNLTGINLTGPANALPSPGLYVTGGTARMHRGGVMTADRVDVIGPGEIVFDGGSTSTNQESKLTVNAGGLNLTDSTTFFNVGNGTLSVVSDTSKGSILALNGPLTAVGTNTFVKSGPATPLAQVNFGGGVRTLNTPDASDRLILGTPTAPITLANGGFTKAGSGSVVLYGPQGYGGATTISAGTLQIAGALTTSSLTIAPDATLAGTGSVSGTVTLSNGPSSGIIDVGTLGLGTLTVPALTFGGLGSVGLTRNYLPATIAVTSVNGLRADGGAGSVILSVSGDVPAIGKHLLIDYSGTIQGTGFNAFSVGSLPNRVVAQLFNDVANTQIMLDVTRADVDVWRGAASSTWKSGTQNPKNWVLSSEQGTTIDFATNDAVEFNDSAIRTEVDLDSSDVAPASVRFTNVNSTISLAGSFGITDVPGGTTAMFKSGAGTVNIFTENSFSGVVRISAGKIRVNKLGDIGLTSALGSGGTIELGTTTTTGTLEVDSALDLSNKAVTINGSGAQGGGIIATDGFVTLDGAVSGNGALTKAGTGTLQLSGANAAYAPGIKIDAGVLRFFNANSLGNTSKIVTLNGGVLEYADGAKLVFADPAAPRTVTVTSAGGGFSVLTGDPKDGGGLWFSNANAISGTGPLSKDGPATLRLTAANGTLTSPWVINEGAVEVGVANAVGALTIGSLGSGAVTINSTGILVSKNVTIANAITLDGGTLSTREGDAAVFAGPITISGNSFARMNSFVAEATQLGMTLTGAVSGEGRLSTIVDITTASSGKALSIRNPANTFSGTFDITPNQTLLAQSSTNTGKTLGTATVELQSATLRVRDNGVGNSGNLAYGNAIVVKPVAGLASTSTIDIGNSSANTTNTVRFGGLTVNAEATPLTTVNLLAANSYIPAFDGASNLTGNVALSSLNADLQFNGVLSGDASVAFSGSGRAMALSNTGNTFSGSILVNSGAILRSQPAATGNALGTASVRLSSGTLQIRDNGTGNNGVLSFGNNLTLNSGTATIDASRVSGSNTGNTVALGNLTMSASAVLNATSTAGYKIAFGDTTVTTNPTFSPTTAEIEINGGISGAANTLTKSGVGRLALNGVNTFTGNVNVTAGTLGGVGSVPSAISVASGGTINPGNGTGIFSVGTNISFVSGANYSIDLGRGTGPEPVAGEYDQLRIGTGVGATSTGTVALGNANLVINAPGGLQNSDIFFIIINDGTDAVTGTFNRATSFVEDGYNMTISYTANFETNSMTGGNDVAIMIPEPTGVALMFGGLATLLMRRRRNS